MGILPENYIRIRLLFTKILGGKCRYCGSNINLEFDHIYPSKVSMSNMSRSKREWHWFDEYIKGNIQLLCKKCNNKKQDSCPIYHTIGEAIL
jgi:5-methylcytosine-specific restriction endonuclease McrA